MAKTNQREKLLEERRRIARRLARGGRLLRGSQTKTYRTCGNPRCKCAKGEKHGPYLYVSVYHEGRTRLVYVPKHMEKEVLQWVDNVRQLQQDIRQISHLNVRLLKLASQADTI